MKILGLLGFGYNPGAALVVDGRVVAHCEEERFTRLKGSHFMFPGLSAAWCLRSAGLGLGDVDYIAWGWDQPAYRVRMPLFYVKSFLRHGLGRRGSGGGVQTVLNHLLTQHPKAIRQGIREGLWRVGLSGRLPEVVFVPHHEAHAASAFLLSGFPEANILVLDGSGERHTTSIFCGEGRRIRRLDGFEIPNSLGWMYAAFTDYLGFIPYRDEGKVMGLAAYGKERADLMEKADRMIAVSERSYRVDPQYTLLGRHEHGKHYSDALVELFGPPRYYGQPLTEVHRDVAYVCQRKLEEAALALLRGAQSTNPSRRLCLAGGVALNCKMNGVLRRSGLVDEVFVQPSASDAGASLGAAVWLANELGEWEPAPMEHAYYGPGYGNDAIRADLDLAGVRYQAPDDLPRRAAQALAADRTVALFQGRLECGARALGNRSILANPMNPHTKDRLNQRVKFREPWRPFCPSLHEEAAKDYLVTGDRTPFMIVADLARGGVAERFPSVVHVDGSVRPQTVTRTANPTFWAILDEFRQATGHPLLLNTSFNVRGEPLIENPRDAIRCFFSTGLDAMVLGGYWVEKAGMSAGWPSGGGLIRPPAP